MPISSAAPNKHQLAGRKAVLGRNPNKKRDLPPPHVRNGESPYKPNPAIKWARAKGQTPAQADKIGKGKINVKGRTQATLSQFSYEEIGEPVPWERQPNESAQAYRQFQVYRDQDPCGRGYAKVAEKLGLSHIVVTRNGAVQRWVERAAAWDFQLERARLQQTEQYQVEMAARHAEIAKEMLERTRIRLRKVNLNHMGPKEIAQWLEVGVKVERLSRGLQSDSAVRDFNQVNVQVNQLSDKEIMIELGKEANRSGGGLEKSHKVLDAASS